MRTPSEALQKRISGALSIPQLALQFWPLQSRRATADGSVGLAGGDFPPGSYRRLDALQFCAKCATIGRSRNQKNNRARPPTCRFRPIPFVFHPEDALET